MKHLVQQAESILPRLIELRRAIHRKPELGLQTPVTARRVRKALEDLPLEFRSGPSSSGLVAVLRGSNAGRTVLLRGDMDALPLHEDTGLTFASSINGVMHACGHDAHTAMLVGAARLLCASRNELPGNVIFMFQPGEEGYHGARHMLEDGLLDPLPDAAFAMHLMPNLPHGMFSSRPGAVLASSDRLKIVVRGKGSHASMPHDGVDPIPVACEIVLAIQSLVTRRVPVTDPAVVTIARITSGTTDNVTPDKAELFGTIRTLSAERRADIKARLGELAKGIATAHGADAHVDIEAGFPVTVSDKRAFALGEQIVQDLYGVASWVPMDAPIMGAEDFSYVLEKVPGAFFLLGAAHADADPEMCQPLHSPGMTIDESVMARGAAFHAAIAFRFLEGGFLIRSPEGAPTA